jgi:ribonuclease HII
VGAADAFEIDRINILQASRLAMRRAIERLNPAPDYLLVDAVTVDLPLAQRALIHGDALSQCIAAASILAKVERDACMREWDLVFPNYGLKSHKGYSTGQHWKALEAHGPTPMHRFSFWPVREHSPHTVWTGYPRQGDLFVEGDESPDVLMPEDESMPVEELMQKDELMPEQDLTCIQ